MGKTMSFGPNNDVRRVDLHSRTNLMVNDTTADTSRGPRSRWAKAKASTTTPLDGIPEARPQTPTFSCKSMFIGCCDDCCFLDEKYKRANNIQEKKSSSLFFWLSIMMCLIVCAIIVLGIVFYWNGSSSSGSSSAPTAIPAKEEVVLEPAPEPDDLDQRRLL